MNVPFVRGSATLLESGARSCLRSLVATKRPKENAHGPTSTPEYAWSCSYQRLYSRRRSGSRVGSTIVIMACPRSMCVPSAMVRGSSERWVRDRRRSEAGAEHDFDRAGTAVACGGDRVAVRFERELVGDHGVGRE